MDDDGAVGAQAAAVYFLELDSYMQASGDTAEWEAMSHASCDFCGARLKQAKKISARGDVFDGDVTTVSVLHTYRQDGPTGIWPLDVQTDESPSRIKSTAGDVLWEQGAKTSRFRVEVGRRDDQWVIVTVADVPKQ